MIQIFRSIGELVTLKGVARKDGRRIVEEDLSVIHGAALIEKEGRLVWLGRESELSVSLVKDLSGDGEVHEYIMNGVTVMPSFTESHTHLIFSGHRRDEFEMRHKGMSYEDIANRGGGILSTVKATRGASAEDLFCAAKQRVDHFIRQGVTCLEVKSGYGLDLLTEIKMLEVASRDFGIEVHRTFLGAHACPLEYGNLEDYMNFLVEEVLPDVAVRGLATRADIFIDKGYFNIQMALIYLRRAKKLGFQLTAHVEQLHRTGGAKLALEEGALSVDHLVQANTSDISDLSASDTVCVFLPGADLYLQMPYPPARSFIDMGACVALATDFNPGSCPTQDLSLIGVLARLEMKMTLAECLSAYIYGGAKALGLHHQRGSLELGKYCDFISLDASWRDLFYSIGYHPVSQVWHRGRLIQ